MEFRYYDPLLEDIEPKVSVDGLCPNSLHLSHRPGNETPARWKADLSTEIAFNFAEDPDDPRADHDLVVNDRLDTDGLLGTWVLLDPDTAASWRDRIVGAAAAGDFLEIPDDEALKLHLLVEGYRHGAESPLSFKLDDWSTSKADEVVYEVLLEMLPALLDQVDDYQYVWWDAWKAIDDDRRALDDGTFAVDREGPVATIRGPRMPAPVAAHDAVEATWYLYAIELGGGTGYRLDADYHSWAETVDRSGVEVPDRGPLADDLDGRDPADEGRWRTGGYPGAGRTEVIRFADASGGLAPSGLDPGTVRDRVGAWLDGRLGPG